MTENKETKLEEKEPKKVAIVGCAESRNLAPFDDKSFEIWGVNNLYSLIPRADRWFEIHDIKKDGDTYLRRDGKDFRGQTVNAYLENLGEWAKEHDCKVYMQKKWDIIPTSVEFPLNEILSKFGGYFTNSISYQLALAIHEGFTEIHVYGVDMAVDTEYHHQRPSCEFFLGLAVGCGIKVHIPQEADLLKARFLYGFNEPQADAWEKKTKQMKDGMTQKRMKLEGELERQKAKINQYIGAEQAVTELDKIWSDCKGLKV